MNLHLINASILSFNGSTIVNTANSSFFPGLGLDGQIHQFGGSRIEEECLLYKRKYGNCNPGNAIRTTGGNLLQDYVIHAVGPLWKGGNYNEENILYKTYMNSLKIADDQCNTNKVAFPNISTGIFAFPKEKAAKIALKAIKDFKPKNLTDIFLYCFEKDNFKIYNELM